MTRPWSSRATYHTVLRSLVREACSCAQAPCAVAWPLARRQLVASRGRRSCHWSWAFWGQASWQGRCSSSCADARAVLPRRARLRCCRPRKMKTRHPRRRRCRRFRCASALCCWQRLLWARTSRASWIRVPTCGARRARGRRRHRKAKQARSWLARVCSGQPCAAPSEKTVGRQLEGMVGRRGDGDGDGERRVPATLLRAPIRCGLCAREPSAEEHARHCLEADINNSRRVTCDLGPCRHTNVFSSPQLQPRLHAAQIVQSINQPLRQVLLVPPFRSCSALRPPPSPSCNWLPCFALRTSTIVPNSSSEQCAGSPPAASAQRAHLVCGPQHVQTAA
jgi:hypothetical protein